MYQTAGWSAPGWRLAFGTAKCRHFMGPSWLRPSRTTARCRTRPSSNASKAAPAKPSTSTPHAPFRQVLPRHTAQLAGEMMTRTVTKGTAKKAFQDSKGRPFLPGIRVAGKTGTLSRYNPHRTYNWWVGYAPVDDPKIAVAALVVNEPKWRIKASYVAREALREYLVR